MGLPELFSILQSVSILWSSFFSGVPPPLKFLYSGDRIAEWAFGSEFMVLGLFTQ
jgi:hypothetical protein